MANNLDTYRTMDTIGMSQLELILKVYDGLLGAYRAASEACRRKDTAAAFDQLEKAKRFVTHLYTTLDFEKGGQIAEQLGKLYAFALNQTNMVQATKDLEQIDEIIHIFENLRGGWSGLKEQQGPQGKQTASETTPTIGDGFTVSA